MVLIPGLGWVHYLTELDSRDITFRVDLMDFDMATAWEEYLNFNIASEAAHFQITFSTSRSITGYYLLWFIILSKKAVWTLYYHIFVLFRTWAMTEEGGGGSQLRTVTLGKSK